VQEQERRYEALRVRNKRLKGELVDEEEETRADASTSSLVAVKQEGAHPTASTAVPDTPRMRARAHDSHNSV
jgi:hypothetical protein